MKALVVLRPGATATAEAPIEHCRAQIANSTCPRSVECRESLPTSGANKVLKREVRALLWEQQKRRVH